MAIQLTKATGPGERTAIGVLVQPEFLDPAATCRFLKANFPDVYREVWYEIVRANGGNRIAIEGAQDEGD